MASIAIAYTGGNPSNSYNIVFDEFLSDDIPRTYDASASFGRTASGATSLDSRAGRQKFIWGISILVPSATAQSLDNLFQAWDYDRAQGLAAACGLVDQTFGSSVSTNGVFSSPPSYRYTSCTHYEVSFGLTEV